MRIAHDYRNAGLDEKDLAMLEYAEKVTLHGEQVDKADIERASQSGLE